MCVVLFTVRRECFPINSNTIQSVNAISSLITRGLFRQLAVVHRWPYDS
jgi:hypothetical protein